MYLAPCSRLKSFTKSLVSADSASVPFFPSEERCRLRAQEEKTHPPSASRVWSLARKAAPSRAWGQRLHPLAAGPASTAVPVPGPADSRLVHVDENTAAGPPRHPPNQTGPPDASPWPPVEPKVEASWLLADSSCPHFFPVTARGTDSCSLSCDSDVSPLGLPEPRFFV